MSKENEMGESIPALSPELAALESSLGELSPAWNAETAHAIAVEAAHRVGFAEGRKQGQQDVSRRTRFRVAVGSMSSAAIGVAASLLIMLVWNQSNNNDNANPLAGRNDIRSSDPVNGADDTSDQGAREEGALEGNSSAVAETDQDASNVPDGDSAGVSSAYVRVTTENDRTGRSWQLEKLRWVLDYDAQVQDPNDIDAFSDDGESGRRNDYLRERNRVLSDANLL